MWLNIKILQWHCEIYEISRFKHIDPEDGDCDTECNTICGLTKKVKVTD
jgi:hypothetical protein